jgi:hypothetical protein
MVRRANTQAVSAQMYRHFAVLTVAITLVVGVFADGESRQAVASEVRAAQKQTPEARPTKLVRKDVRAQGSFSADGSVDSNFGAPMDTTGAAPQDGVLPSAPDDDHTDVPAGFTQYGVSAGTWSTLTDAQKKALMARQQAAQEAAQSPERGEQIDSLLAASRTRSGQATTDD